MKFDNVKELSEHIKEKTEKELKETIIPGINKEIKELHADKLKEIEVQKKIKSCQYCRWVACKNYGYDKPICDKFINEWDFIDIKN